jgi:glycosyltransferase involved in cell wall biosynthesis
MIFVSNDPSTDRFISEEERSYLAREVNYISKEKVGRSLARNHAIDYKINCLCGRNPGGGSV